MKKTLNIPFELRGVSNIVEVIYMANDSANESGFDSLPDLPFDPNLCLGYPTMHAYIKDMKNTGYRRLCGWIQLIHREYCSSADLAAPDENNISVDTGDPTNIYFGYGYPAEIYDAPCNNLNGNAKGKWTAFTYLVDTSCRMSGYKIRFLAGFKWGYEEEMSGGKLLVKMLDIEEVNISQWRTHISCMKAQFPNYNYAD